MPVFLSNFLSTTYTGPQGPQGATGPTGPLTPYTVKTANYTAVSKDYISANTIGGAWTLTLPASPSTGDFVVIADAGNFNTVNLTIARNGSTIEGNADNFELDVASSVVTFLYDGNTWQMFSSVGPKGPQGPQGPQGATGPQGPSSMSDGTEAAPGLPFANNTATGFYRPAANTLGFVTASVERMRIDSTGRMNVANMTISANVDNSGTGYFALPVGTTAQRPNTPATGMQRMNTTTGYMEYYNGTNWEQINSTYSVEFLVVAGGGSGGATNGGGGGGGGYLYAPTFLIANGSSYTVTVGAGGAGSTSGSNNGNDSVFHVVTATKGGAGSLESAGQSKNGGSGGGGRGEAADAGGTATAGQGNNGGNGAASPRLSAGGGGAGAAGQHGADGGAGGNGSNSLASWATATASGANSGYFAGGGGGGTESVSRTASGGLGGGGASGNESNGVNGTANTGGGGGGGSRGGSSSGSFSGGSGGSGIVIIRYSGTQRGTGGTVYNINGYTYHKFITSGTFTA